MICKMIETKVKRRRCFEDICEDGSISERTQYRLFPQVRRDLKYFSTERLYCAVHSRCEGYSVSKQKDLFCRD